MLINNGYMSSVACSQNESMEAGLLFARTKGIAPPPETNDAIKGRIDLALQCKQGTRRR